jgi:hypothetical protein
LAAVISLVAAPAMALTLEFDTAPTGAFTSFTDDGFLVTVTAFSAVIAANGSPGNDIEASQGGVAGITITTATPGGTFIPTSFLYAIVGPAGNFGDVESVGSLNGSEVSGGNYMGAATTGYSYSSESITPSVAVDTLSITLVGFSNAYAAISDINLTPLSTPTDVTPAAVPEPPALSVLGTGILALAGMTLLRHKKV